MPMPGAACCGLRSCCPSRKTGAAPVSDTAPSLRLSESYLASAFGLIKSAIPSGTASFRTR